MKYCIGLDIGSSSIKVALIESESGNTISVLQEPENEMEILSPKNDWAEQNPELWWRYLCKGIKRILNENTIRAVDIVSIGIAYQMHGLVIVDKDGVTLRNSIIWCDSRAVEIGKVAYKDLGKSYCLKNLLNAPGNFTASKLKWVKENEPNIYGRIHKMMLPGDYIAYKLSGKISTTSHGLSEGILWDFENKTVAFKLLEYYGLDKFHIPEIVNNFEVQGTVTKAAAEETGLCSGTPITYRAGDQPNNALSLNVFYPGEVAATGGTSGVLYAIVDELNFKEISKVNQFAHANYSNGNPNIGRLLNVNGAGIMFRWIKNNFKAESYIQMNEEASTIEVGSDGLILLPYGNGAERMFNNKIIGSQILNLNLNQHNRAHIFRAALEGIAFSFCYGIELLKEDNTKISVIRAGNDNLFRSSIFGNTIATLIGQEIEIYNVTGAVGAARASSIKDGDFKKFGDNLIKNDHVRTYRPKKNKEAHLKAYENWKKELNTFLNK